VVFFAQNLCGIGQNSEKPSLYFEDLTQKIGIKNPILRKGEYQIRLWVNTSSMSGQAQELCIITAKNNYLCLKKLDIWNHNSNYLKHIVSFDARIKESAFLEKLLQNNLLTFRDSHFILDSLRQDSRLKNQQRDKNTRIEIIGDTVRVIGQKPSKEVFLVDGRIHYVEVFGKNFFRKYRSHCPKACAQFYKDVEELQKMAHLIQLLLSAFGESKAKICHATSPSNHSYARL